MSNKTFDTLKFFAQVVLPAVATLYFTLAQIWGLPYAEEIVGTIAAIDTFLGVLLGVSTSRYNREYGDAEGLHVRQQRADWELEDTDYSKEEADED